ncbi:hypothetical protein ACFE04_030591 [Oxalis oulophora]
MISSWRRRRAARFAAKEEEQRAQTGGDLELTIPNYFRCPISLDLMKDPVTLVTGITYDRENIEKWIEAGNVTCPITSQVMETLDPIPNHVIRRMIQDWCVENKSNGIERIPTPRIPVSTLEIAEILVKIERSSERDDQIACQNLVAKIKRVMKESERNKRCIVRNGTARVLAAAFNDFSRRNIDKNDVVLEEILSTLTLLFPLDGEAKNKLASPSAMKSIIWLLKSRDLSRRRMAILSLRQIVSSHEISLLIAENEDAVEAVFKVLKDAICPTTTKASLIVIHKMMTTSPNQNKNVLKFIEMGLVTLLLELLVETDKSSSEKSLLVLEAICCVKKGRQAAFDNALTIPVLVKKILRVSGLGNETVVSILWNLCINNNMNGEYVEVVVVEALFQLGAFQKLLLLLQVGCSEVTKQKTTELLKCLNMGRDRVTECIDSTDYKSLKRNF